ncbi:MAG: hypothetical protein HZY76_08760 [Anaerolineae bacterium]|nr:MAG: hypothetical protein HZY76_08760 [Anaerolineae bacterium]
MSANSSPVANGCSSAIPPVSGVAAGNVVYWQSRSTLPTFCGAWNGGSAGTDFTFTVEVTAPSAAVRPGTCPGTSSVTAGARRRTASAAPSRR